MKFFNNKGFVLVETVFLTLIVSFTAMMILRGYKTAVQSNQNSAIRTAALYVAQAQMAEIENYVYENNLAPTSYNFLDDEFLTYENFFGMDGTLKFTVETKSEETINTDSKRLRINVKVSWKINNTSDKIDQNYEKITKDIWISQKE